MVDLPGTGAVVGLTAEQAGGLGYQLGEHRDADGEIRTPDQAGAVALHGGADGGEVLLPAGGADHQVHTEGGDLFGVRGDSGGNRKIDCYVDAAEVSGC